VYTGEKLLLSHVHSFSTNINSTKKKLSLLFIIKDLGVAMSILRIEIICDWERGTTRL
jgi:hypothetical protein